MRTRVLLIVDDDKHVVDILSRFFASYHYTTYTAETCKDALRLSERYRPDCLLLDFHLRDGKGDRVCRAIRSNAGLKHTPIVMLSVDPTRELNSYLEYQADSFILKGSPLEKIRAVVESVLRRVGWDRGILHCGDIRLEAHDFSVFRDSRLLTRLSPDQFHLLFLLMEKNGEFISDARITAHVLKEDPELDKSDAVRSLICRLRKKLGPQVARRIKTSRDKGWIYLQPRERPDKLLLKLSGH